MKRIILCLPFLALAACGVDGEPIRPQVSTNVYVSDDGVRLGTDLSASRGPVKVTVGLGS